MGSIKKFLSNEKNAIFFTIIVVLAVSFAYFGVEGIGMKKISMESQSTNTEIYQGIELKTAYGPNSEIKAFALAKNNALSKYKTLEGNPIPENKSIVIGEMEAEMMKSEDLFSKVGDKIEGLFGINTTVEGILMKTNSPADYLHFLSNEQFERIEGKTGVIFIKIIDPTTAKVFYKNDLNTPLPQSLKFAQGKINDYKTHEIAGITYYPIIIGNEEAKMMQEEKVFNKLGDTFEKFGQYFILTGVLEKNNSIMDLAHIVPLDEKEIIIQ